MSDQVEEFKKLLLNRDQIDAAMEEFAQTAAGSSAKEEKGSLVQYTLSVDGQTPALLNLFPKKDGTTTIQWNVGKNQEFSLAAAKHVVDKCSLMAPVRTNLSIPYLSTESRDTLLGLLIPERAKVEREQDVPHGKSWRIKGVQGDEITVNHYESGAFVVQGQPLMLLGETVDFLLELVEDKRSIVEAQLKTYSVNVSPDDILGETRARLPRSSEYVGDTIVAVLSPAVVLEKLDVQLADYSSFVLPVLRGLEGYIKKLFLDNGIHVGKEGIGEYLSGVNHRTVSDEVRVRIGCDSTCTAINQCYGYYQSQRHGLVHFDGAIETTRIVDSIEEVREIVDAVFGLIDETFAQIPK